MLVQVGGPDACTGGWSWCLYRWVVLVLVQVGGPGACTGGWS